MRKSSVPCSDSAGALGSAQLPDGPEGKGAGRTGTAVVVPVAVVTKKAGGLVVQWAVRAYPARWGWSAQLSSSAQTVLSRGFWWIQDRHALQQSHLRAHLPL